MERDWQLQTAKAKLSEVVQAAQNGEPQHITVRGKRAVVVLAEDDFRRLRERKPRFIDFIRQSPLAGLKLDLRRDKSPARAVDLE